MGWLGEGRIEVRRACRAGATALDIGGRVGVDVLLVRLAGAIARAVAAAPAVLVVDVTTTGR